VALADGDWFVLKAEIFKSAKMAQSYKDLLVWKKSMFLVDESLFW
jgi:hypothetical protein